MTEVEVNGTGKVDLDTAATKTALVSSSTTKRLASLHTLEERLSNNGMTSHTALYYSYMYLLVVHRNSPRAFPTIAATSFQHIPILPRSKFEACSHTMHKRYI